MVIHYTNTQEIYIIHFIDKELKGNTLIIPNEHDNQNEVREHLLNFWEQNVIFHF